MATNAELLARLAATYPEYWAWLQTKDNALRKIRNLSLQYTNFNAFMNAVMGLQSWATWSAGQNTDDPPGETPPDETMTGQWVTLPDGTRIHIVDGVVVETIPPEETEPVPPIPGAILNPDGTWTLPNGTIVDANGQIVGTPDILATLTQFLIDNELPTTLIEFIKQALLQGKPYAQIIAELRQTAEYKSAYPENDVRRANGLSWMPEAEIRAYRDEAKRLAYEYMGVNVTNAEISSLIGRGTSLRQWEHRLQVNDLVQRFGPAVQQVFESYTGTPLSEERLHAFLDPDFATPDIDRLYALSLMRGQPAELGFGIRPEDEALALEKFGIDPNRVFENYRSVATELPRFERLAAIGQYLETNGEGFFTDISVSGSLLFRAIMFGDPRAIGELQRRAAEETARFQSTGGPARSRTGQLGGLTVPG